MRRVAALLAFAIPLAAQQPAPAAPAPAAAAQAAPRAFTPNDWYKVTQLSTPAMSPDGKLVAFTVTTVVERENRRHSEVWAVSTAGGAPVRYTSPGYESSNARFSPDGKYLFFTSTRPGGRGNTWALRMDQPGGEASQVEGYPSGSLPKDKSFAVFTSTVDTAGGGGPGGPGGRGGPFGGFAPPTGAGAANAMAFPPFGAITKPVEQVRFDGRQIVTFPYKANGFGYLPNPRAARVLRSQQIFTQKFDGSRRVQVTDTRYSHREPVVSPDGKWIAFTADAQLRPDSVVQQLADSLSKLPYDATRDDAPRNDRDIFIIRATGGEPRRLASLQGDESNLEWSPDGRKLLFISRAERTKNARLMLIDAAGGAPQNLTNGWQYEPSSAQFLPNGEILMSADIGARTALFTV
ncbi:MAG: TolB family protein, partial [Gemmatimonadaceae bacterium]